VTGGSFSGFDEYAPDMLVDLPLSIAEIHGDGTVIITKHQHMNGIVTEEVVTCQFLYELQGAICLDCTLSKPLPDENLRSETQRG
jgi:Acyclic terpene utilisation family protein AtuA